MTKREMMRAIAERSGTTMKTAETVVDALWKIIAKELRSTEHISIAGFGTFEIRHRKPRIGRNPHTGAVTEVPACKAPVFRPSKALRESMNETRADNNDLQM